MREITTETTIDASPERVWEVLTDFAGYPDWNPFITRIEGSPEVGERLDVDLRPAGRKASRFTPTVVEASDGRGFAWEGRLGVRGLFDGRHSFEVHAEGDDRTRFVHSERFTGILVKPIMAMIGEGTEQGFHAMNSSLKQRAESA